MIDMSRVTRNIAYLLENAFLYLQWFKFGATIESVKSATAHAQYVLVLISLLFTRFKFKIEANKKMHFPGDSSNVFTQIRHLSEPNSTQMKDLSHIWKKFFSVFTV